MLSTLSASCKKERQEGPKVNVDKDFLKYAYFNNGTQWIYRNVVDSSLDICTVTGAGSRYQYHNKPKPNEKESSPQFEEYSFEYIDRGLPVAVIVSSELLTADFSQVLHFAKTFYKYGGILGPAYSYNLFKYPYAEDTLRHLSNEATHITERLDSVVVQNQAFYDAITCRHDYQASGSVIREITYAKGVGPIRKVYWDGSTWELIDYTIQ
ncbi:MAG TPA: hypothetical protein VEY71_12420 [Chitinophagales bacterium]|nr:hypothetical protein [Chitinophagales bacterium]